MSERSALNVILLIAGSAIAVTVFSQGCSLILKPLTHPEDAGSTDTDIVESDDGSEHSDGASLDSDSNDSEREDSDREVDGGDADVDVDEPASTCEEGELEDTIALFTFDDTLGSEVGGYEWTAGTNAGCREFVEGQDGCGQALFFGDCSDSWLTIPDDALWDDIRSIDLWLLSTARAGSDVGVISRDAQYSQEPGHFMIEIDSVGVIRVRVQTTTSDLYLCSYEPIDVDRWYHVEVRLGESCTELWLDGVKQLGTHERCNTDCRSFGIAGNDEPWVLGGSTYSSSQHQPTPVIHALRQTAIDHLRFRRSRP